MNEQSDLFAHETEVERYRRLYDDGTYPTDFWPWLEDNRHLFVAFVEVARRAKRRGFQQWSARAIWHILRWESAEKEGGQDMLKVNNNATPGLARLAMKLYPDLADFFETRKPPARDTARRLIDGRLYSEEEESHVQP